PSATTEGVAAHEGFTSYAPADDGRHRTAVGLRPRLGAEESTMLDSERPGQPPDQSTEQEEAGPLDAPPPLSDEAAEPAPPAKKAATRKTAAKKAAAKKPPAKKTAAKKATRKAAAKKTAAPVADQAETPQEAEAEDAPPAKKTAAKKTAK